MKLSALLDSTLYFLASVPMRKFAVSTAAVLNSGRGAKGCHLGQSRKMCCIYLYPATTKRLQCYERFLCYQERPINKTYSYPLASHVFPIKKRGAVSSKTRTDHHKQFNR